MTATTRVLEFNGRVYRRTWRAGIVTTFLSPVLFLASLGFGLGRFVDSTGNADLGGVPYAAWLAPGLLAASAMQTGGFAATYTIVGRIRWDRIYHGMLATPITIRGIVSGELGWISFRLALAAGAFLLVMTLFGLVYSPLAILALPAAMLTGLAFAAPIMAYAATQQNDQGFTMLFRFGLTPLFILSGTFFPIDQLPEALRILAAFTPLWHGVRLTRSLTLGQVDPILAVFDVLVLGVFIVGGWLVALVTFRRALVS